MNTNFEILHEAIDPLRIPQDISIFDPRDEIVEALLTRTVKILIVVDGSVGYSENGGFGVGRLIKLLREEKLGCYKFEVDIADRSGARPEGVDVITENPNAGDYQARYVGFSFDSKIKDEYVLNRYHEVLLFGFAPDNEEGSDSRITSNTWHSHDDELEVLHQWMNEGGGVFATGDHDYLGASMCHRIPRVGTMREWTNDDGVPSQRGENRLDTNQPANDQQEDGTEMIPIRVEEDENPQKIDWITNRSYRMGFRTFNSPHEILCHPELGPINVMPDHPHEGRCVDNERILERLDKKVRFGKMEADEYPRYGINHPRPKIIAYGNVTARSNHERKGRVNSARFPMISVYNGRKGTLSDIGRVVVDSTWHHWFNMNIIGIEGGQNQRNWEKIKRYYLNVASWITPKNMKCNYSYLQPFFETDGIREINSDSTTLETGFVFRNGLSKILGPCSVTTDVLEWIYVLEPKLYQLYENHEFNPDDPKFDPLGPYCLSCPPLEILEAYIFGSIFRILEPIVRELNRAIKDPKRDFTLSHEKLNDLLLEGAKKGIELFLEEVYKGIDEVERTLR